MSTGEPISSFRTRRRVEFADTDLARQVHFARFFVFMETAEHEFLESLGAQVHMRWEGREIGWPRLEAHCTFLSPARLGDVLEIELHIVRKGRRSLTYAFTLSCGERIVARGRMASACCALDGDAGLEPVPIPAFIADRIAEASSEDPRPRA